MEIIKSKAELTPILSQARLENKSIGLVPTMGALHVGHVSLVERSVRENDITICTIFVNPTQFNNNGDLVNYPRREEDDAKMLAPTGCQIVFIPTVEDIYPPGEDPEKYAVDFGFLANFMEGEHRPGHFKGVGIIISKFFEMIHPTRSYYGEKDYQQLLVIKKLNELKNFGVEVIGCTTFREPNGLAMSSRNLRLNPEQQSHAALIYQCLQNTKANAGQKSIATLKKEAEEAFQKDPFLELEYFEIADATTLVPINSWEEAQKWVACTAAFAGEVRLIDNLQLN